MEHRAIAPARRIVGAAVIFVSGAILVLGALAAPSPAHAATLSSQAAAPQEPARIQAAPPARDDFRRRHPPETATSAK
ncbi:MAG: hypothetical protein AAF676_04800, partial [Pseudomonadota bacterium]